LKNRDDLFREIVEEHLPTIRRVCRAYLYDRDAADDLCQEILLQLWKHCDRFEQRASLRTYLYRIAVNTAISYNRKGIPTVTLETVPELPAEDAVPSSDGHEHKLSWMYRAIQQLEEMDRLIISLVLEDLSYQQIADVVGLSVSHVGVKINRIKGRLQKLMPHELRPN
jgi:RNA polymerase sigma factor (sigma-70 family)